MAEYTKEEREFMNRVKDKPNAELVKAINRINIRRALEQLQRLPPNTNVLELL